DADGGLPGVWQLPEKARHRHHQSSVAGRGGITPERRPRFRAAACRCPRPCYAPPPMTDPLPADYRARLLQRYVSTHSSVGDAAAQDGLERRRAYLDDLIRRHFPADRNTAVLDLG